MMKHRSGLGIAVTFGWVAAFAACDDGGDSSGNLDAAASSDSAVGAGGAGGAAVGDGAAGAGGTAVGDAGGAGAGGTAGGAGQAAIPSGNAQWAKSIGAPTIRENFSDVGVDALGNVYLYAQIAASLDLGNGATFTVAAGKFAHVLVKYDANGVAQWIRPTGANEGNDSTADLIVDGTGNVYLLGSGVIGGALGGVIYLQKWNVTGDIVWTRQMGNDLSRSPAELALDGAGNVYAAGAADCMDQFGGARTLIFGTFNGGCVGSDNVSFVVKYDAAGTYQWVLVSKGSNSWGTDLAVDTAGNITLGGYLASDTTFGTTLLTHTKSRSNSFRELYLARIDPSGASALWAKQIDDTPSGMNVAHHGTSILLDLFLSAGKSVLGMAATKSAETFVTVDPATGNATALKPWSDGGFANGPLVVNAAGQILRGVRGPAGTIIPHKFDFKTPGGVSIPKFNNSMDLVSVIASPAMDNVALVSDIAWDPTGGWVASGRFNRTLMLGATPLQTTGATDDDMWILRAGPIP